MRCLEHRGQLHACRGGCRGQSRGWTSAGPLTGSTGQESRFSVGFQARPQRGPVISTHLILTARSTPSHGAVRSVSVRDLAHRYVLLAEPITLFATRCIGWVKLRLAGWPGWLRRRQRASPMLPPCPYHPIMTASLYRPSRPMRARYLSQTLPTAQESLAKQRRSCRNCVLLVLLRVTIGTINYSSLPNYNLCNCSFSFPGPTALPST